MYLVSEVNDDAKQKHTLILPNGESVLMFLEYKPMQYGWFITQLVYKDFEINSVRVCTGPNLLHQFKNKLPFGIAIFTDDDQEPTQQEDFLNGRAKFYILDATETKLYSDVISGQVSA